MNSLRTFKNPSKTAKKWGGSINCDFLLHSVLIK